MSIVNGLYKLVSQWPGKTTHCHRRRPSTAVASWLSTDVWLYALCH